MLGEDPLYHRLEKFCSTFVKQSTCVIVPQCFFKGLGHFRLQGGIRCQFPPFLKRECSVGAPFRLRHQMTVFPEDSSDDLLATTVHRIPRWMSRLQERQQASADELPVPE